MANFIRALFGAPTVQDTNNPPARSSGSYIEKQITAPEIPRSAKPYFGRPVPLEADLSDDKQGLYTDFYERALAVVANDKTSILLFPSTFRSEDGFTGEIRYDEWFDEDGDSPHKRLDGAARIYEHLSANGPLHPALVQYKGRTKSGFRLERLHTGHLPSSRPRADGDAQLLALYQRWALQLLSTLAWLHAQGVVLNAMDLHDLWLRQDYSIAIANLVNAGSAAVGVSASEVRYSSSVDLPWSAWRLYDTKDVDEITPGDIRGDIFD